LFAGVDDYFWLWLHTEGYRRSAAVRNILPGLPPEQLQFQSVGVVGDPALRFGLSASRIFKRTYERTANRQLSACRKVLDFGCGWGRIIRFFLKDIPSSRLYGIDVYDAMIAFCQKEFRWGTFIQTDPLPPTGFPAESFDFVYALSVLSHLSEDAHHKWLEEFKRILAPGGVFIIGGRTGAGQGSLVRQYLTESALVTAISLVIGFVLAWILHPWFARAIGQPETLFNLFDPAFLAFSLAGFVVLALAVGAYPAFYLASVRPRSALGEGGVAAPGLIGQVVTTSLLGLQIAAATGLLIVSMTMGAQANYIETRPMGFVMKDRYQLVANCPLNPGLSQTQLGALFQRCQSGTRDLIKKTAGIEQAFYFGGQLVSETVQTQAYGRTAAGEEIGRAARMSVDTDFLQGMGATLLAGRFFDLNSAYDRQEIDRRRMMSLGPRPPGSPPPPKIEVLPVIVTRATLAVLGAATPEDAIGQRFAGKPSQYPFEVVGVVEDWQTRPLKYSVIPIIFVPSNATNAVVEIAADRVDEVKASLIAGWREVTGDEKANVQLQSMSDIQERTYQTDYRLMRAISSFAMVAIVVAGLGVYGLSAFEMRRRVREIGIRKALGASPMMVAGRIIGRQVAFATVISLLAWPVGFWIGNQWLLGFVYRTQLGWFVPLVATLVVMAFVAVAVGLSSARAAAMRPGLALQ
jgi:putative ABC transport system permease protein